MVETLKLKEKNKIEILEKIAETRMAVYIYIYIVCCLLENKKEKLNNNKIRDRTILKLDINRNSGNNSCDIYLIKNSIGLSFSALKEKNKYKRERAGPREIKSKK